MNFIKQKNQISWKWICCVLLVTVLSTACKNEALIRPGDSLDVAYKKSLRLYRSQKYREAANAFETVINTGRGTDYAQSAQFFLAEAYFKDQRYLLSANGYNQYISLFPNSPKREEAAFKEALSYFSLSPRYKIDQKFTRQSIEKFRLFLSRYPDSEYADDAGRYLTTMRAKLAEKHYGSAKLYRRTDQYKAAIIYYDLIIDQYPETSWAEQALVDEIDTYNAYAAKSIPSRQRERYQKAVESYEKYVQLFPEGKNRQKAESSVDDARSALADLGSPADQDTTASADQ